MKRLCLSMLLLHWVVMSVCITSNDPINVTSLSSGQETEYQTMVRERPEDFSYNPLQVGNKWWRGTLGGPHYIVREVIDSLLINNQVYYEVTGLSGPGINYWVRNEGDISLVYDQFDLDNNPSTLELVCEDFTFTDQTGVYHDMTSFGYPTPLPWDCLFLNESFLSAFGVPTYLRWHHYYHPEQYNSMTIVGWARGFGMFQWTNDIPDGTDISVIACKINGILYGDTSVLIEDNTITPMVDLRVSCFPNPFQSSTHIKYEIPSEVNNGILEILNVRGQILRKEFVHGAGVFSWSGTDNNGQSISSGIYICRVSLNNGISRSTKLIYLR